MCLEYEVLASYKVEIMVLKMTLIEGGSSWICRRAVNIANKDLKRKEAGIIRDLQLTLYRKENATYYSAVISLKL